MNDTLSTPDPAEQLDEVRRIITHRGTHSCEATMFAVFRVVFPAPADKPAGQPDMRPIATDEHGWPMLNSEGTAWERHDDPDQN